MDNVVQYDMMELLEQSGARPRGNRHDCPKCGGLRTVTHSEAAFYCHHCQWKGNKVTLAKELGLYRRLPPAEYRELRQRQERAREAALRLYSVAHERELELRERIRVLGRLELAAHDAGPERPETWEILAGIYAELPEVEERLDALESGDVEVIYSEVRRHGKLDFDSLTVEPDEPEAIHLGVEEPGIPNVHGVVIADSDIPF